MTEHLHDDTPADTDGDESMLADGPPLADGRNTAVASQWQLMWWKFRRHRLAMAGLTVVVILYLIAAFAEFLAPFDPNSYDRKGGFHPPQAVHLIDRTEEGGLTIRPWVWETELTRDPRTLVSTYQATGEKTYLRWFGEGDSYELWGLIPGNRHLLTPVDPDKRFYLLGADRLGRDMLSRTIHGARLSLLIGLIGVAFSLVLGITLGGLAGYLGGWVDTVISRSVELVLSLPTIPIWLALAAALPATWSTETRYFFITLIVSLVGWTELARVVRGRFMSLKNDDFVVAAVLDNAPQRRVIFRHMLPSLTSHIIASVTLAVPLMILAETSLSFLGLGLMPPAISWGVLLKEAQDVRSIVLGPWLFAPGVAVVITVLAFNFLGDGLRDAADPYN
ncbi:ABC transporter permease [Oceaniglobus trochenteri]|uniref:ABC transporter permease n=1 Tax=Oceaniglobus trochenteri TaxID=2763260 RepID=UPI001D001109|nr:ABC transporter permease [Oceaniglobus trochenteri]